MIIAIDPGPTQSAVVHLNGGLPIQRAQMDNRALIDHLRLEHGEDAVAIEMIACYGMPVGAEVFSTCVWIGRFIETIIAAANVPVHLLTRSSVKLHHCQSPRANDATVRQALIDRYGPGKEKAIGLKGCPGPLYGFKEDLWAALAVACAFHDGVRGQAVDAVEAG